MNGGGQLSLPPFSIKDDRIFRRVRSLRLVAIEQSFNQPATILPMASTRYASGKQFGVIGLAHPSAPATGKASMSPSSPNDLSQNQDSLGIIGHRIALHDVVLDL